MHTAQHDYASVRMRKRGIWCLCVCVCVEYNNYNYMGIIDPNLPESVYSPIRLSLPAETNYSLIRQFIQSKCNLV